MRTILYNIQKYKVIIFEMMRTLLRVYKFSNIRQRIKLQRQSRLGKGTDAVNLTIKSQEDLTKIRNIGIIAHIDAGKTTTTQRMLYYAGALPSPGNIDQGTTAMDFLAQQRQRGITIRSAAISFNWVNHQINLIDTPGHVDFSGQVTRSLRVLDGVVTILDGVKGVQAQTQKVWAQATKHNIPKICFINKMDRIGSSAQQTLLSIKNKLGIQPLLLQMPIGDGDSFRGVIDLIQLEEIQFNGKYGELVQKTKIQKNTQKHNTFRKLRQKLVQTIANYDQEIGDLYLKQEQVSSSKLKKAIRKIIISSQYSSKVSPVLMGASVRNLGVQPLLDAVLQYLPSPTNRDPVYSVLEPNLKRTLTRNDPFLGYVFKVLYDVQKGPLAFTRIYSGHMIKNFDIFNSSKKLSERIGQVLRVRANQYVQIQEISAGDIVALSGLEQTSAGDTLTANGDQFLLQKLQIPNPIFTAPFELESGKLKRQFDRAMNRSIIQDTSLRFNYQNDTGQYLVSGLGQLHLQILRDRLISEGIPVKMGSLKINFKQTVSKEIEQNFQMKKQIKPNVFQQFSLTVKITPFRTDDQKIPDKNSVIFTFEKVKQFDSLWSQFTKKKLLAKNPEQRVNYTKEQLSKLKKNVRNPTPVQPMYQQIEEQEEGNSGRSQNNDQQQSEEGEQNQEENYYHVNTLPFDTLYELVQTCKTSLSYGKNKLPAVGIQLQIKDGKYKRSTFSKSVMNRCASTLTRKLLDQTSVLIQPIMEFNLEGDQAMIDVAIKDVLKKRGRVMEQQGNKISGFVPAEGVRGWIAQLRSMGLQIQLKFSDYEEVIGINPEKLIEQNS